MHGRVPEQEVVAGLRLAVRPLTAVNEYVECGSARLPTIALREQGKVAWWSHNQRTQLPSKA